MLSCSSAHTLGNISELREVVFREITGFFRNGRFILVINRESEAGVWEPTCLQSTTVSVDLGIIKLKLNCPPKLRGTTQNILTCSLLWKEGHLWLTEGGVSLPLE